MALVTPEDKLYEIIIAEPAIIPLVNRFDISLGVGDRTIAEICANKGINIDLFVTIVNAYINESFSFEKSFESFGAQDIISYLRMTNNAYMRFQIPNIERHFSALISHSTGNNNLELLFSLFQEVKQEITSRIENDEQVWFKEILEHENCAPVGQLDIDVNENIEFDTTIEDKICDLKNMFVIHLKGDYDRNLCHAVLFAIISLEKDLKQNDRIRNNVLYPLAVALKKQYQK